MAEQAGAPITADDIERVFAEAELRLAAGARARALPDDAQLWMALVPRITITIAAEAGFPFPGVTALDQMAAAGIVERLLPAPRLDEDEPDPVYIMLDLRRAETLQAFSGSGEAHVLRILAAAGEGIGRSHTCRERYVGLWRWASLAATVDASAPMRLADTRTAAALTSQVNSAFDDRDPVQLQAWIDAARPLADLLAGYGSAQLLESLQRAGRRLELLYRRTDDERRLRSFVERPEQVAAVRALLDGHNEHWALHLIGAGGVGKTMLIRYMATTMVKECYVARVDFDYLNPDYPSLNPGLLLWAFAQELRLQADPSQVGELFAEAEQSFEQLRQSLESAQQAGTLTTSPTRQPAFVAGVRTFIEALRLLDKPVVLIVDTCEELAKARADGSMMNLDETFRILRALHDGVHTLLEPGKVEPEPGLPMLRVVFSGRRLLASAGDGWRQDPPGPLVERPFLRIAQLRGFSRDEAEAYLRQIVRNPDGLTLPNTEKPVDTTATARIPDMLVSTIVGLSAPDAGATPGLVLIRSQVPDPPEARCNPYTLHLYADWATTQPTPTEEELRSKSIGRYIEERIVGRIADERLQALLPLVALIGHIDQACLTAGAGIEAKEAERLFARLILQL